MLGVVHRVFVQVANKFRTEAGLSPKQWLLSLFHIQIVVLPTTVIEVPPYAVILCLHGETLERVRVKLSELRFG